MAYTPPAAGQGVSHHSELSGNSESGCHPISAIVGLQGELDGKAPTHAHPYESSGAVAAHEAANDPHSQYTTAAEAAAAAPVQSVAGRTGAVTLAKADVGLGNVDNTSDASKPVSTAVQTALDGKQAAGSYASGGHNHDAAYEPKNSNIQTHVVAAHAPSDAQKNSDITKAEIEAKLTGVISSHSHAGLTSSSAFATAQTTISAATYADITGCSISLAAGTWLIIGQVNIGLANAIIQAFVAITDGANAVISEVAASRPASGTASLISPFSCNPIAIVSPGVTTTYKLRGARGLTTHTGSWTAMDGNGVNTANHATNNSDKGTGIFAVRLA